MTFKPGRKILLTPKEKADAKALPALPSLPQRAANYAEHLVRDAAHVLAGGQSDAPEELKAARLSKCAGCRFRRADGVCIQCGCPTEKKAAKTVSQCPLQLW